MKKNTPLALIILDGLGINPNPDGNAVFHAKKKTLDTLFATAPSTELITCGERVGLPPGQMGNSEVGHLNIGAGRVVMQELSRINKAIRDKALPDLPPLKELCQQLAKHPQSALHLVGLVSLGGVHSYLDHLTALIDAAIRLRVSRVYIHAITDGRDRPPQGAVEEVGELAEFIKRKRTESNTEIEIVSVIGRYFAMDRDRRWERTEKAYQLFTLGKGARYSDCITALKEQRKRGANDEFLEPMIIDREKLSRSPTFQDQDGILFFNFRADRMRQIVESLSPQTTMFSGFARPHTFAFSGLVSLTEYEPGLCENVLFEPVVLDNHFGKFISGLGYRQLRLAETEKYPHVTYFFNGGIEDAYPGEHRVLIPSPRDVATYDLKPQMSAYQVTDAFVKELADDAFDVAIVNFANCDMVGHTGVFSAAVTAVETVDTCLGRILGELDARDGVAVITADHGNAEKMIDYETRAPHTAHTTFPVPFFLFGKGTSGLKLKADGALCDIAPTMLQLLGCAKPREMTGTSLIS